MKKSLLITTSLLTLGVVTGIYAQTTGATGTIIDKMKAVAHSFTLSASLNPTDTSLSSDPIKGKKTGDILTAGEYNRILELISEGGGGSGWVNVPLTDTADFDENCLYRYDAPGALDASYGGGLGWAYPQSVQAKHIVNNSDSGAFGHIYSSSKSAYRVNGTQVVTITKMQKLCSFGGSGAAGSAWTSTCPTGMSLVGTPGTRNAFCIETNLRTGTIYHNAAENCRTAGRSLCTYEQWTTACLDQASTNRKPAPALVGVHSSREWILGAQTWSGGTYQGGMVIGHLTNSGSPSCLNSTALDDDVEPIAATVKYRCCSY